MRFLWQLSRAMGEFKNAKTGVFWDYDSSPIPSGANAKQIVSNLMHKLNQKKYYGPVVIFRIYGSGIKAEHKEAFQRTGIDLIDVPLQEKNDNLAYKHWKAGEGVKKGVNKRMAVDMLFWTKENHAPVIVAIISKNEELAVCTQSLEVEGYNIMSTFPKEVPGEKINLWEVT